MRDRSQTPTWADEARPSGTRRVVAAVAAVFTLLLLLTGCLSDSTTPEFARAESSDDGNWQEFSVAGLRDERIRAGTPYYEAKADSTLGMGLLHVGPAGSPSLIEHAVDVAYVVVSGAAKLSTVDADFPLDSGTVAFVRGGVEHRFREVTAELDALVVFATRGGGPGDPDVAAFSLDEMVAARNSEQNVWTPMLETSGLNVAMYMLPKNSADVSILEHTYDEFKIVLSGGGRFDLGGGGVEVGAGSVTFIGRGTRHQYRRTSDALDVVVLASN